MKEKQIIEAISPQEILNDLPNIIPSFVFEAVNTLLKQKFRGESVTIKENDILNEIIARSNFNREHIIKNKWLDFESVYAKKGWVVTYDKPGYNENYNAYFEFSPKKI